MRAVTTGLALAVLVALAANTQANGAPCAKHTGAAKQQCTKAAARNAQAWPANPTWSEVVRRARPGELSTLRRIAECEQPGTGAHRHARKYGPRERWRTAWGINGAPSRYQGAYGMFSSTYAAGAYATKYPHPPAATPAQETGVAIMVMRRWGPSAWGCHR